MRGMQTTPAPSAAAAASPTHVPACPSCGTTNVAFDFDETVTVRLVDGQVQHILVGPCLERLPDRIFCDDCGEQSVDHTLDSPARPTMTATVDTIRADLPLRLAAALTDGGLILHERPQENSR